MSPRTIITFHFFGKYREAIKVSLCLQVPVLFVSSSVLDGGDLLQYMMIACTAYWLSLLLIVVRRNGHASPLDVFLIAWGYPMAIVATALVATVVPLGLLRR